MRKKYESNLKEALHKHQARSNSRTSHRLSLFAPKARGIPTIFLADAWLAWRAWPTVSRSRMKCIYSEIDPGSPCSKPFKISTSFISDTNWTDLLKGSVKLCCQKSVCSYNITSHSKPGKPYISPSSFPINPCRDFCSLS